MQPTKFLKVNFLKNEPLLYCRESIDVGLLGENYHQSNLIVGESLLSSEDNVPML
jgi:hypothetical protein